MDWLLFWQIAGPIVGILGIGATVFLIFWTRREKVKINVTKPRYSVNDFDRVLRVFWSCESQRLGGEEVRYIAQICLKPDTHIYRELQKYFIMPKDGVIRINKRLELARGKIVSSGHGDEAAYPEYEVVKETKGTEKWREARQLASELELKRFEVGLVWEDGGKSKWKMIKQEDYGWITL